MTNEEMLAGPITPDDRVLFDAVTSGLYTNFAIMSGFWKDEPTSVIVSINPEGEDFVLTPLYVRVTESMLKDLKDSYGNLTTEKKVNA